MVYGDGDGVIFILLFGGIDVIGYELMYVVIENSLDLIY